MTKMIGKNFNAADEANSSTVSVGSTTAVTLLAAQTPSDAIWSEVNITNDGFRSLWVRKRAASADNNKDGIRISPGETYPVIKRSENYTGEISGIFQAGGSRDVHVEWF